MREILPLFLFSFIAQGQVAHPRIWLDGTTLTRLNALVAANDPSWVALKAKADNLATLTVSPYSYSSGTGICYGCAGYPYGGSYRGSAWYDSISTLALAYKMTGNTAYSTQVKAVLNAMAAGGVQQATDDRTGYAFRFTILALALGYDWCYDQLSPTDKANYTTVLDTLWNYAQTNSQMTAWYPTPNPYDNFYSGDLAGFGLAALAVEGDDPNAAAMQAFINDSFATNVSGPSGIFQKGSMGGFPIEGIYYGGDSFIRFLQFMWGMKTAGKNDLLEANSDWVRATARMFLYNVRPDLWSETDEGDFAALPSRATRPYYMHFLANILSNYGGYVEGQWVWQQYLNLAPVPDGGTPASYYPGVFQAFLNNNSGLTPLDYSGQPLFNFSPGDQHTYARTDWTTAAAYVSFNSRTSSKTESSGHTARAAGHVAVLRGGDYLLINTGNWHGPDGITGRPGSAIGSGQPSWMHNTLYYSDIGLTGGQCRSTTITEFAGCQGFYGTDNTILHKETADFVYQKADLRPAYLNSAGSTTLSSYYRTFLNIGGDVTMVYDRMTTTVLGSTRQLFWHTPALNTATPPGNSTAVSVNGGVMSATVGSSKIWINTLLPVSPTITQATNETDWGNGVLNGTQRFMVADPNASTNATTIFLTVISPTASSVSTVPPSTLIDAGCFKGALYNDGAFPRIGLFSLDGSQQSGVSYSVAYDSQLAGRHVVLDLKPGVYTVRRSGVEICKGILVGNDGSLSFQSNGGGTFNINMAAPPPATIRERSTLNGRSVLR